MRPDAYLTARVSQNGLGGSVEEVRGWLRGVLREHLVGKGGGADERAVERIFSPVAVEDDAAALLQAHVRRMAQRYLLRYREMTAGTDSDGTGARFLYGLVRDKAFPPGGASVLPRKHYWLPAEIGRGCCGEECDSDGGAEGSAAAEARFGEIAGRVISMQELLESRGQFRRRFRDLLRLRRYQRSRLEEVCARACVCVSAC